MCYTLVVWQERMDAATLCVRRWNGCWLVHNACVCVLGSKVTESPHRCVNSLLGLWQVQALAVSGMSLGGCRVTGLAALVGRLSCGGRCACVQLTMHRSHAFERFSANRSPLGPAVRALTESWALLAQLDCTCCPAFSNCCPAVMHCHFLNHEDVGCMKVRVVGSHGVVVGCPARTYWTIWLHACVQQGLPVLRGIVKHLVAWWVSCAEGMPGVKADLAIRNHQLLELQLPCFCLLGFLAAAAS